MSGVDPPGLRRLLGRSGPDVGCEVCFEELDRYVELELAGADADAAVPGMRAHLEGCPACAEEHASLIALVAGQADAMPRSGGEGSR
jgi:anti-sigma factor RsiW